MTFAPMVSDANMVHSLASSLAGVQRATDPAPPAAELPLVGNRPLEPATLDSRVPDYRGTVGSATGFATAPRSTTKSPSATQLVATVPVPGPRAPANATVQRSMSTDAFPPPPVVPRSPSAIERQASPSQPLHFVQYVPASYLQRANDELPVTTAPVTTAPETAAPETADSTDVTGALAATGATSPGQPAGSTSPTEIDKLVHRLYDPIVRRLRAELQRDRERAGRSLDLWH